MGATRTRYLLAWPARVAAALRTIGGQSSAFSGALLGGLAVTTASGFPESILWMQSGHTQKMAVAATLLPRPPLRISGYYRRLISSSKLGCSPCPFPRTVWNTGPVRPDVPVMTPHPDAGIPNEYQHSWGGWHWHFPTPTSRLLHHHTPGRTLRTQISSATSQAHRPTICS